MNWLHTLGSMLVARVERGRHWRPDTATGLRETLITGAVWCRLDTGLELPHPVSQLP